jgi:citron Rho-interacting kinase
MGGWERKWVNLEDNRLCIYNKEANDNSPIDTFNLFPVDADVTVSSAVNTSELVNTASTDLPYIMKIETRRRNSSLPGRSVEVLFIHVFSTSYFLGRVEPQLFQSRDFALI